MSDHKEREAVKNAYPKSKTWAHKVDKMPEAQVIALYNRFRAEGKLGR